MGIEEKNTADTERKISTTEGFWAFSILIQRHKGLFDFYMTRICIREKLPENSLNTQTHQSNPNNLHQVNSSSAVLNSDGFVMVLTCLAMGERDSAVGDHSISDQYCHLLSFMLGELQACVTHISSDVHRSECHTLHCKETFRGETPHCGICCNLASVKWHPL